MSVANIPSPSIQPQLSADITKSPASPRGYEQSDNLISAKHQPTTSPSDDKYESLPDGPITPDDGNPTTISESQSNLSSQDVFKLPTDTNVDPFAADYDTNRYFEHVRFNMENTPIPRIELKIDNVSWMQINTNTIELRINDCKVVMNLDDPRATIMSIFEKNVMNEKTRIKFIDIRAAIFPPEYAKYTSIVRAEKIYIRSVEIMSWLNIFVPKCEGINLSPTFCLYDIPRTPTVEIPWTPLLSDAKSITVRFACNINDDQLISSRWETARFDKTNVTEIGLNLLIKKWIDEKYEPGAEIVLGGKFDWRKVVEGFKYKNLLDDEDAEEERIRLEIKLKHKTGYFVELYRDSCDYLEISIQKKRNHSRFASRFRNIPLIFHYFYNKKRKKEKKREKEMKKYVQMEEERTEQIWPEEEKYYIF